MKLFLFFWKCYKFNVDSKNAIKKHQNVFGFSDKSIWSDSGNLSLSGYKNTWLGVSMFTSSGFLKFSLIVSL